MNPKGSKIKRRFYWDAEKLERLRLLILAGLTRHELAEKFGAHRYSIDHAITNYGLNRRTNRKIRHWQDRHKELPAVAQPPSEIPWPDRKRLMARR